MMMNNGQYEVHIHTYIHRSLGRQGLTLITEEVGWSGPTFEFVYLSFVNIMSISVRSQLVYLFAFDACKHCAAN